MMAENPQFGKDLNKFLRKSCSPASFNGIHILSPLELQPLHRIPCAERGRLGGGVGGERVGTVIIINRDKLTIIETSRPGVFFFHRYICTRVRKAFYYAT